MAENAKASVWDEERLRAASNAAGIAFWSWNMNNGEIGMEEGDRAFWGLPKEGLLDLETPFVRIHPEDGDRVRIAFSEVRRKPDPYEIDFRVRLDGGTRWFSARGRGRGNGSGSIEGRMFGVFLDVTERKHAEDARDLLADEMNHWLKNLFAVASGLAAIAARSTATTADMARDLVQRLGTLASAQDLIRPDPGRSVHKAAFLGELLAVFLAPYDEKGLSVTTFT